MKLYDIKVKIQRILTDIEQVRGNHVSATLHAELNCVEVRCKELITELRDVNERTETVLIQPVREAAGRGRTASRPDS